MAKLESVVIIQDIENHVYWEEKVLVVKGDRKYWPLAFFLNSVFKLKEAAVIFPGISTSFEW